MKARILVVEDEPLIAMMLGDWLDEIGHETRGPFRDVSSAAAFLKESPEIDAALLDVQLAEGDSYELAAALARRKLPFAFLTGQASGGFEQRFADAPVLAKPFDLDNVRETVSRLLGEKAPPRTTEATEWGA